jgi:regulator of protease activity HflC (stomatin/prohibitin superfamily)
MEFAYVIALAIIVYLFASIRVLRQYERGVVFFLGKFEGVRGAGLTLIFVPIQQMVRVSLRTVTMQIPSQKIITKDNVSIDIAAVAYYRISDPEKAVIVIEPLVSLFGRKRKEMIRVEKFTMSGREMRTYRCDQCQEEHIVDYGIALWKAMSDSQSDK